jgi:hypothetical protein
MLEQGQTDLYLLNGPQSLMILEQALKKYGVVDQDETIAPHFILAENSAKYFVSSSNYALNNKPAISSPIPQ